jgi:hypothetical protein
VSTVNPASADVLKKGIHSCQNGALAVKVSPNEIFCRASIFSNSKVKDGLKTGTVYECKSANVVPFKTKKNGETYITMTDKVKCN